ncbi:MAG: ATP-binding protein [Thomasclavelia sp.]|jgi:serine/threonine-protein kinase RsbT|nr:ATP-binding protein [Thomasclavelia sp.]
MIKKYDVIKDDYVNAGKVSTDIKKTLKSLGVNRKVLKAVAIASYEGEINITIHSDGGVVTFELDDNGVIHLSFDDIGPGIKDLELALKPGYSTASSKARELGFGAGMGLFNMKSVASTFDIKSSPEGTHIKMTFI